MYHVRNSCEVNIILNQSMHDWDASILHEFWTDSLLNKSNYCYGNTAKRCSGICYGSFYCTVIKYINKVLRLRNSFFKISRNSLLQTKYNCQFCCTSKFHPKLVLNNHKNDPRPDKNYTLALLLKMYNKYVRVSCMFCFGMVEKPSSLTNVNFLKEFIFQRQDH